jgi:hypothetical protein
MNISYQRWTEGVFELQEPEKLDWSRDLQVMQDFYKGYREKYHIEWVEGRLRKQEGSTDQLPDKNRYTSVWIEAGAL